MSTSAPAATATDPGPVVDDDTDQMAGDPGDRASRAFLPPGRLDQRSRRLHKIILAVIMVFGLAKGAYWSFSQVAINPLDETQHLGYVESLARGDGIPTVGRDRVSDEIMGMVKQSTLFRFRNEPFTSQADDPGWGPINQQYEAIHGPTYYALMVPAYWAGRPFGPTGTLYAERLATVMLALSAVPLTWALARRLFPDHPAIWLGAPAVLVTIESSTFGTVGNDALVMVLGVASCLAVLWSLDRPESLVRAACTGALVSATIVTKTTSLAVLPLAGLLVLTWLIRRRPSFTTTWRWLAMSVIGAVIVMAPWLAWNFHAYRSISAAAQADAITGAAQAPAERSLQGVIDQLRTARVLGLWATQLTDYATYRQFWERTVLAMALVGITAAAARRRWRELGSVLWCASALPLAFLAMEAIVWIVFGGNGGPTGRHLNVAMGPTAILVAAGPVIALGRRWGVTLISGILVGSLITAAHMDHDFIKRFYLRNVTFGSWASVQSQTWSDEVVDDTAVVIAPECPVRAIALGLAPEIPDELTIVTRDDGPITATLDVNSVPPPGNILPTLPRYVLERPTGSTMSITIPPESAINVSTDDRASWSVLGSGRGSPVAVVYCDVGNPDETSFDTLYPTLHPRWMSLGALRSIPIGFAALGGAAALAASAWAVSGSVRRLRTRRDGPGPASPGPASPRPGSPPDQPAEAPSGSTGSSMS